MKEKIAPIIEPIELINLIKSQPIILIDARGEANATELYCEEHLEGALRVDLNHDMADIKADAAMGGRHPLPSPERFCQLLERLGISPESHVVVYDQKNGSNAAARFWWMMKSIGHIEIQFLNGGLVAAKYAGFPTNSITEKSLKLTTYNPSKWSLPVVMMEEVELLRKNPDYLIIDVRDASRYDGISEPIDLIAGHIPGATNIPYSGNLDEKGNFLPKDVLANKYLPLLNGRDMDHVMVHCGSGVTACHTILALAHAEIGIPKLYVGSWSEWSRNNMEMVTAQL